MNNENIVNKIVADEKEKEKITLTKAFMYFFVYSIAGFIIETLYALIVCGTFESRKSFMYGPFCAIYGVGALVMIFCLNNLKHNKYVIFFGGMAIGAATEYLLSFLGELLLGVRWWDYSSMAFNLNGRICLAYSFFWGILAVILMKIINPMINRMIEKLGDNIYKTVAIAGVVILLIDFVITGVALFIFFPRFICENNINVSNYGYYEKTYEYILNDRLLSYLSREQYTDEIMLRTFPNLKYMDVNRK